MAKEPQLVPNAILGYKSFYLSKNQKKLVSPSRKRRWTNPDNLVFEHSYGCGKKPTSKFKKCDCGLYAAFDMGTALGYVGIQHSKAVLTIVEGSGYTIKGDKAFRSEKMKVVAVAPVLTYPEFTKAAIYSTIGFALTILAHLSVGYYAVTQQHAVVLSSIIIALFSAIFPFLGLMWGAWLDKKREVGLSQETRDKLMKLAPHAEIFEDAIELEKHYKAHIEHQKI